MSIFKAYYIFSCQVQLPFPHTKKRPLRKRGQPFCPPCAGSSHGAFGAPHATRRCAALRPTFVYVMAARSCRARFAASLLTVRRLGQIERPRFEPMQDLWAVRLEALQRLCGQPKICRPVQGRQKHAASKKAGPGGVQGISRSSGPSSAPFL